MTKDIGCTPLGKKRLAKHLVDGGSLSPHQLSALTSPFAEFPYLILRRVS